MTLIPQFATLNDIYKRAKPFSPKGILIHSTGANNPNLKRYVQPDNGQIGANHNGNHWNRPGTGVCVHAFIGKLETGKIATCQILPWEYAGVHCGGSGNNTHLSF